MVRAARACLVLGAESRGAERPFIVEGRRVAGTGQQEHRHQHGRPGGPARGDDRESECHSHHGTGHPQRTRSQHGVADVAAIQLCNGKQVERGGQQPEPGGEGHRMHVDGEAVWDGPEDQPRRGLEQQRFAQFHQAALILGEAHDLRQRQARKERRYGDRHAGERSGDADVEQGHTRGEARPDADERPERAGQGQGHGQEVGPGGVDPVVAAGQHMAHLMAAQDGQDCQAVPESGQQERGGEKRGEGTGAGVRRGPGE